MGTKTTTLFGASAVWVTKTANYIAFAGDLIAANTSGGSFTITLPATPTVGNAVTILDGGGRFAVNNLTIANNGNSIQGNLDTLILDCNNTEVILVYTGATRGWAVVSTQI